MRGRAVQPLLLLLVSAFYVLIVVGDDDGSDDDGSNHDTARGGNSDEPQGQQANDVQEGLHDMERAKDIIETATGKPVEEAKTRIQKLKEDIKKEYKNFNENRMRQKEYGQSLKDAGNGIVKFTRGIRNNDWKESLAGAIDFVGGFVFLSFPWGPVASGLLSIASSILGIFSKQGPSTAEVLKNIVQEESESAFIVKVKGVIKNFGTLHQSLGNLKEQLNASDYSEEVKNKVATTAGQYQVKYLTPGTELLPEFERRRNDNCNSDEKLPKCGRFLMLYITLKSARKMALALLAGVLQDVDNDVMAKNLRNTIKDAEQDDIQYLRFLADPYHSPPNQRKVVALLWENRWFYESLFDYLVKLQKSHSDQEGKNGIFRDDVLLCTEQFLMGECNAYMPSESKVAMTFDAFRSTLVPPGYKLTLSHDYTAHSDIYREVFGPDIISQMFFNKRFSAISVSRVDLDEHNVLKQLRACEDKESDSPFAKFSCHHFDYGDYENIQLNDMRNSWKNHISRIHIPAKMKVTAYTREGFNGKNIGPFIGPYYSMYPCKARDWASLKIEKTNESSSSMVEISDRAPQEEPGQQGAARLQIDICGNKQKGENVLKMLPKIKVQGCPFENVAQMRIPGQTTITGYSRIKQQGREYRGWNRAVGWKPVESTWKSMKIKATCAERKSDNPQ